MDVDVAAEADAGHLVCLGVALRHVVDLLHWIIKMISEIEIDGENVRFPI